MSSSIEQDVNLVNQDFMKLGMDIYQLITDFSVDIHYVVALILSGCAVTYAFTKMFHKGHTGSIEDSIDFLEKVREQISRVDTNLKKVREQLSRVGEKLKKVREQLSRVEKS